MDYVITKMEQLQEIVGTSNFKIKILNSFLNEYETAVLSIQIINGTKSHLLSIYKPQNKRWVDFEPVVGVQYTAKMTYYEKHGKWSLVPISTTEAEEGTEDMSEHIIDTPVIIKPKDLPMDAYSTFTSDCVSTHLDAVDYIEVTIAGKNYNIEISDHELWVEVNGKNVTLSLSKNKKKLRIIATREQVTPVLDTADELASNTVWIDSQNSIYRLLSTSIAGNTVLVKYSMCENGFVLTATKEHFLQLFKLKSDSWYLSIPPEGMLVRDKNQNAIFAITKYEDGKCLTDYGNWEEVSDLAPLTEEEALKMVYNPAYTTPKTTPIEVGEDELPF